MLNRTKIAKKNNKNYLLWVTVWTIVSSLAIFYGVNLFFNPTEVHSKYVDDGKTYSFNAVGADNLRQKSGDYLLTLINKDNELIDVVIKETETKERLLAASETNPVRFIGQTYNALNSDSATKVYFVNLRSDYFKQAEKLYGYQLIEKKLEMGLGDYVLLGFFIILFLGNLAAMLYLLKDSRARLKKTVAFFEQNPYLNSRAADLILTKHAAVVGHHIFMLSGRSSVIDLTRCQDITIKYHAYRYRRHGPYHSLEYRVDGELKSDIIGLLSTEKLAALQVYIDRYQT